MMTMSEHGITALAPDLAQREEQHYASILVRGPFRELAGLVPTLWSDVSAEVERQGAIAAGAPFLRYVITDAGSIHEIEVAVPVLTVVHRHGRVRPGVLPAGEYVVFQRDDRWPGLLDLDEQLLAWGRENGVVWQTRLGRRGRVWAALTASFAEIEGVATNLEACCTAIACLVAH